MLSGLPWQLTLLRGDLLLMVLCLTSKRWTNILITSSQFRAAATTLTRTAFTSWNGRISVKPNMTMTRKAMKTTKTPKWSFKKFKRLSMSTEYELWDIHPSSPSGMTMVMEGKSESWTWVPIWKSWTKEFLPKGDKKERRSSFPWKHLGSGWPGTPIKLENW